MWNALWEHWLGALVLAGVLVLIWAIAVLTKYVRLMLNIFRDTPIPPILSPLSYERLDGRQVRFRAFDGTRLEGMFLSWQELAAGSGPPSDPPALPPSPPPRYLSRQSRGVILFCHEYGSDMHSWSRYARGLLEAGFDVFAFSFRGHGQSSVLPRYKPGLWCTDKEVLDCLGALELVQSVMEEEQVHPPIGLFGISRGGAAAILTAAAAPALPVRAVLVDSAFSSDLTLETFMRKWVHIFARVRFVYENHKPAFWHFLRWILLRVARIRFGCQFPSVRRELQRFRRRAVMFIHGQRDSCIAAEQARILFDQARPPRYLWIVPDARHNQSVAVSGDLYRALTVGFFERHLAGVCREDSAVDPGLRAPVYAFFAGEDGVFRQAVPEGMDDAGTGNRILGGPEGPAPAATIRRKTGTLP
ncbi:MAG: alpha/beta fold hydrolase [Sedimentisphaerales bacterium]|nr:alpha/beta fold hydrolase [Sedimentisphaerales bacterium]